MLGGYYSEQKSKKPLVIGVLVGLAVVGVVAAIALTSSKPVSALALQQVNAEQEEFNRFVDYYGKEYKDELEYSARFQNYRMNAGYIRAFNTAGENWALGINQFADMTFEEFRNLYLREDFYKPSPNTDPVPELEIPSSVDWRTKGAVTDVKNQGQCGSCWSFSAAGSIEGAWALAGHTLVSLSEQQLVDCSGSYGNQGCNGGLMDNAFKYVMAHGIATANTYPYKATTDSCDESLAKQTAATISSYHDVTRENADALKQAIAQQPVSVAVEADQLAWQFYFSGVIDARCGTNLDHGVLAVGYDASSSPPYYWVKNSWGSSWGLSGYVKIGIKDGDGVCGIQMSASYPIV